MPGMLAHVREVDSIDPVRDPACAAEVLALDAGRGSALLLLARLIQRADHQAAPLTGPPRRFIQAGHREPAHHAHRRKGVPRGTAEQPLRPARRPVSRMLGDRPAITPRQAAGQRTDILAGLQIALTNASGQIIARDNSAPFTWAGNACMIEFSFSDTPRLPGYGVRVLGLGAGTTWLTPAQASQPVKLSIGPGFAVSGT